MQSLEQIGTEIIPETSLEISQQAEAAGDDQATESGDKK